MLKKTLESPLDSKEIQPVHPKGNQSCVFIGRTDVEAETPILWPPDVKSWLIWKDRDTGKDWGQKKGMTEDEMVGWHHPLDGRGFRWTPGIGDGQGGLACCGSWGHKESDTTDQLNWTELSTVGETGDKMPPKHWLKWRSRGRCWENRQCCPPPSSTRIKSLDTCQSLTYRCHDRNS